MKAIEFEYTRIKHKLYTPKRVFDKSNNDIEPNSSCSEIIFSHFGNQAKFPRDLSININKIHRKLRRSRQCGFKSLTSHLDEQMIYLPQSSAVSADLARIFEYLG